MLPRRKEPSAFVRALLDDEARDTGTLAAELDEAFAHADCDKEMVRLKLISLIDVGVSCSIILRA